MRNLRVGRRSAFCAMCAAACVLLTACYERRHDTVINPDGSGKVLIETLVAVPTMGAPGKEKPTAVSFGRVYAADLVNSTNGADAWSDLSIEEAADGRAHITIVAYFKNLNALRFAKPLELPLSFNWKVEGQTATLSVDRIRTDVAAGKMSDADAKAMVGSAQEQYKQQRLAMQTQLAAFKLHMIFELPGEVADFHVFQRDGQMVSLTLDGKKIAEALDAFMANDEALMDMFRKGEDSRANDDLLLTTMMGQKGPITATVKLGPAGAPTKPMFDYKTESRVADLHQADMFKEAGVELVQKFIVKPAATAPAGR